MWAAIKRHGWMVSASAAGLLALAAQFGSVTRSSAQATAPESKASSCPADNGGISLPKGFCTSIFADKLGHARQLVVTQDGTVYVNTWSGVYYNNDRVPPDGFLVALKDTKGTGRADVVNRFGATVAEGGHGGTGIALYKSWLYAEINDRIDRYPLKEGEIAPTQKAETVLSGMPIKGDHPMHAFTIDANGNLFVEMGSATNACEIKNRMPHSKGNDPCKELETRAGIWRYDANKLGQKFSPAERYATGLRNSEGFDFDEAGRLFVTQHGRDQLHEDWPELYSLEQGFNLPAEEVVELKEGGDYGWPYCYYDDAQQKLVLAPEYGGDGTRKSEFARKNFRPLRRSRRIGRRTISSSTRLRCFRRRIGAVPSLLSTGRGIAHRDRRAAIASSSSRSRTEKLPASSSCSPTDLPAPTKTLAGPPTGRLDLPLDRMARSTFQTTSRAAFGA